MNTLFFFFNIALFLGNDAVGAFGSCDIVSWSLPKTERSYFCVSMTSAALWKFWICGAFP